MSNIIERINANPTLSAQGVQSTEVVRIAAEVQASIQSARMFPRDETFALTAIKTACKRRSLAEASQYAYKRGNEMVTGPSIRLAEALAQRWGNLEFGITELERRKGESVMMSYCIDLETNVRARRVWTVKHYRQTKKGGYDLTDERDIYEHIMNSGARRLRACILEIIPKDITEDAVQACNDTLSGKGTGAPIIDRIRKMVAAFGEVQVTQEMLEKRIGHKIDATNEAELVQLGRIYNSLKDDMSKREDWFTFEEATKKDAAKSLNEKLDKAEKPDPTKVPEVGSDEDIKAAAEESAEKLKGDGKRSDQEVMEAAQKKLEQARAKSKEAKR